MKITTKFVLAIFLLFLFIVAIGCKKQKSEWQGTIKEKDGVTIVRNPNEPIYGELLFDLEEDLSFGNEEDDNYLFYRISGIEVDKDGNIYVLERGNFRVQKFDRNGNYLCTIGRKGQGPGEFQMPFQMIIDDNNGIICVQDMRKLIVFDTDGNYLDKDIFFESFFNELSVDSQGFMWGNMYRQEGDDEAIADLFKVFVKLNKEGQIEKEVVIFPYEHYRERRGEGVISILTGEEHDLFISRLNEGNFVYGYSGEYELNIIDLEGNLVRKVIKEEPYQSFTAKERGKYRKAKIPEHKPFFYDLFSDSDGRIYAQRNNARLAEKVDKVFDIFSRDGYYLYRTVCSLTPYIINNGYFYTRVENEDTGEVFVKRYKIKNWNEMKTGI